MDNRIRKNGAFRMLEKEAPAAIIGAVVCNGGFTIPLVDIYNHPEALAMIDAKAKREGRLHAN
jgi:hypothetical protein